MVNKDLTQLKTILLSNDSQNGRNYLEKQYQEIKQPINN